MLSTTLGGGASGYPRSLTTDTAVPLDRFLAGEGFDTPESAAAARAALHAAGLTNPRKSAIAVDKLPRCRRILRQSFVRSCGRDRCDRELALRHREKERVHVQPASCEHCGGATNRRAGMDIAERAAAAGVQRILIVGGAPAGRRELLAALAGLEVDQVDGNAKRDAKQAKAEMARADLVVIWGNTALAHAVSSLYRRPPPGVGLVLVAASGAASVLAALRRHLVARLI